VLLAPRLYLLAHRTRTRHQRDEPHTLLQAQPQRACTIGLTVSHNAADPVEAKGDTFLNRYGSLGTVTGIPIAQAQAQREPVTAHAETQEHLLEIITAIFAVPIGRTRGEQPFARGGLLLIGPLQGNRGRILMQPRGQERIDLQGVKRDRPQHTVELCGKQRLEHLAEAVIVQRRSF
jgi:hypothetical protein